MKMKTVSAVYRTDGVFLVDLEDPELIKLMCIDIHEKMLP